MSHKDSRGLFCKKIVKRHCFFCVAISLKKSVNEKKKCEFVYRCIGPFTGQIKSKQQRHLVRGTNKNDSRENKEI